MRVVEGERSLDVERQRRQISLLSQSQAIGRGYKSTGWSWAELSTRHDARRRSLPSQWQNESRSTPASTPTSPTPRGSTADIVPVAEKESPVFFVNANGMLDRAIHRKAGPTPPQRKSRRPIRHGQRRRLDMMVNNFNAPAHALPYNGASGITGSKSVRLAVEVPNGSRKGRRCPRRELFCRKNTRWKTKAALRKR